MPLRFFGGQWSGRIRTCPACEREIAAAATFCPSCYLVIRPEGAADLREHLRGARIPTDVYLLRKMQVEDPDTGPVVRVSENNPISPRTIGPVAPRPAAPPPSDPPPPPPTENLPVPSPSPPTPQAATHPAVSEAAGLPQGETESAARGRAWVGVYSLVKFDPPLPPPTHSVEETPALLAWMLERDPVIPNNTELLEAIHANTFRDEPAARLGYEQHLLLQIADDLALHPTQETLGTHLTLLAAAYRRAAGAYHAAAHKGQDEANPSLWQMSSTASRLRVEAWVYRTRHGVPPEIIPPGRARASKVSGG